jgi:hypothetical protein
MKPILSERNLVVVLFIMVLITFSMAQEDSRKMETVQVASKPAASKNFLAEQTPAVKDAQSVKKASVIK